MSKPTDLPLWATTLANDVTTGQPNRAEPSAGKKATGFTFNEKPPRQNLNWLYYTLGKWIEWLDSILNQSLLTTDSPTFAALTLAELRRTSGSLTIRTITSGLLTIQSAGAMILDAVGVISFNKGFSVLDEQQEPACSMSKNGDVTGRIVATGDDLSIRGSATDITGEELEVLSDGSNADDLHVHDIAGAYGGLFRSGDQVFAAADWINFTSNLPSNKVTPEYGNHRLVALAAGDYEIIFSAMLSSSTENGILYPTILKNDVTITVKKSYVNNGGAAEAKFVSIHHIVTLADSDIVRIHMSTSGSFSYTVTDATLTIKKL